MNTRRGRKAAVASLLLATAGMVLAGCGETDEQAATSSLTSVPTSTKRPNMSTSASSSVNTTSSSSSAVSTASSTAKIKAVTPQSDLVGEPLAQDGSSDGEGSADGASMLADGQASDGAAVPEAKAVKATGGGVELKADRVAHLSDGQQVTVSLSGLNPQAGYYLAVCGPNRVGPAPMCIGGQGPQSIQHWLSNAVRPGSIPADGVLTTTVSVPKQGRVATGQSLDCTTQQCTIKLFGDPGAGLRDVVELPVSFS